MVPGPDVPDLDEQRGLQSAASLSWQQDPMRSAASDKVAIPLRVDRKQNDQAFYVSLWNFYSIFSRSVSRSVDHTKIGRMEVEGTMADGSEAAVDAIPNAQ